MRSFADQPKRLVWFHGSTLHTRSRVSSSRASTDRLGVLNIVKVQVYAEVSGIRLSRHRDIGDIIGGLVRHGVGARVAQQILGAS